MYLLNLIKALNICFYKRECIVCLDIPAYENVACRIIHSVFKEQKKEREERIKQKQQQLKELLVQVSGCFIFFITGKIKVM